MKDLLEKYLPNAPKKGLYAVPNIPDGKLRAAINDYGRLYKPRQVLALYDATLMGSAKDGALFMQEGFVYQNSDLEPPQTIRYDDMVRIEVKRKLLGGKVIKLDVNSANATVTHTVDFSGKPDAADFVANFLHEAMARSADESMSEEPGKTSSGTDVEAVAAALEELVRKSILSVDDLGELLGVLSRL